MCVHTVSIYSKHHIIRLYFSNFRYFYFVMFFGLFWSFLPWHVLWSHLFWPYCKKTHVCVVDKPTDKTKKRRVNDGRDCEYEFILWSFLGELALGEEMWTVSVYLCILLALRKIWEKKRRIALHVLGQFKKKNCTEQKWYFLFYLFYFISVYTGFIVMYHMLRHSLPCLGQQIKQEMSIQNIVQLLWWPSDAACHGNITFKRPCRTFTFCPNQH